MSIDATSSSSSSSSSINGSAKKAVNELDSARYCELFNRIDADSNGKIDVNDLVHLFEKYSDSSSSSNDLKPLTNKHDGDKNESASRRKLTSLARAKDVISRGDLNDSGYLSFSEFVHFMIDHENKLELVFKGIDLDNDNKISHNELIRYFKNLSVDITVDEATKLVERINRSGTQLIEPNEWKEYFLFASIDNLDDLLYHWRYSNLVDLRDSPSQQNRSGLWYRNLIAGAVAGAVSRTCTAPFDRLKTVMQVMGSRKEIKIIGGFQHMLNEGGVVSLWRGNGMNVIKIAPEAALKFAFYEELKILFIGNDRKREATMVERFFSGSIAGAMAQSTIYPLELLKTRMVLRKTGEYSSLFDCANKIIKNEGIRAFYKGYLPNILGIIPYSGTDLAVYETLKRFYMKRNHLVDNPPIPVLLMCGTTSTICGQLISYPLALVRTRLQAQEVPMDSSQRDTMSRLLMRIWRNEGVRGLYRGLLPNIIKVVPAVSISYVVYESIKKRLIDPPVR